MLVDPQGASLRALVVVADGMGGHNAGEVAAAMTVVACREAFEQLNSSVNTEFSPEAAATFLRNLLQTVNERILLQSLADPACAGMGTTAVLAAVLPNDQALVAHVGDSRAYLVRGGRVTQLTRDHSALAERLQDVQEGEILSLDDLRNDPYAHALTRSLGQEEYVEPDITEPFRLVPGDTLVLVTDGITDVVESQGLLGVHERSVALESFARELIAAALARNSDDNVTVAALAVGSQHRLLRRAHRAEGGREQETGGGRQRAGLRSGLGVLMERWASSRAVFLSAGIALGLLGLGVGFGLLVAGGSLNQPHVTPPVPPLTLLPVAEPTPSEAAALSVDLPASGHERNASATEVSHGDSPPPTVTPRRERPEANRRQDVPTGASQEKHSVLPSDPSRNGRASSSTPRLGETDTSPTPAPPSPEAVLGSPTPSTPDEAVPAPAVPAAAAGTGEESNPQPLPRPASSTSFADEKPDWTGFDARRTLEGPRPALPAAPTPKGRPRRNSSPEPPPAPSRGFEKKAGTLPLANQRQDAPVLRFFGYEEDGKEWTLLVGCNCEIGEVIATVGRNTESHRVWATRREDVARWDDKAGVHLTGYELRVPFTANDPKVPKPRRLVVRLTFNGRVETGTAERGGR